MNKKEKSCPTQKRESNIELFRIVVMLLIIAHHYVVNSGVYEKICENPISGNSLFALLFGAWGKTGINCFVLITAYFMCQSDITLKKWVKLLAEVMFYRVIFYLIFLLTGYEPFSMGTFVKAMIPISSVSTGFTPAYLLFYLFIPFLNILIKNLDEKKHLLLVLLCLFTYTILGTVPFINVTMNYVSWFIVLYFIGSYIRYYPKDWFSDNKICGIALLGFLLAAMASIIGIAWSGNRFGINGMYYFVADSNKIWAVCVLVTAFLFFKNIKLKYNKVINTFAASTFGAFLIHANSDAMRRWLWRDTLNNVAAFRTSVFVIHAVVSVVLVFLVASVIDMSRIRFFERPILYLWDKKKLKGEVKRES